MMKISVRNLMESVNTLSERNDAPRHEAIAADAHTILNFVIQTTKQFIGTHIQILNALENNEEPSAFESLLLQLNELKRSGFNPNDNGPEKGVRFITRTTGVTKTIICQNPGQEQGMNYLGQYEGETLTLYMTDFTAAIKRLARWFMYISPANRINKMLLNPTENQSLKVDINSLLTHYNNAIIGDVQNLESLISHELAHSYDGQQAAKTAPDSTVLNADSSQRDKVNAKPTVTHADYNNINSETNAIFFEYLPRFIREYKQKGQDMKTFIPYVKDIVGSNEELNPANMKKFLSRLYTFLTQTTDEQQEEAITKLKNYKASNMPNLA